MSWAPEEVPLGWVGLVLSGNAHRPAGGAGAAAPAFPLKLAPSPRSPGAAARMWLGDARASSRLPPWGLGMRALATPAGLPRLRLGGFVADFASDAHALGFALGSAHFSPGLSAARSALICNNHAIEDFGASSPSKSASSEPPPWSAVFRERGKTGRQMPL